MTVTVSATAFLAIAAAMSMTDWVAVAMGKRRLEYVCKPVATTAFLLTAATLDVADGASWSWSLAALVLCLMGDVFLMLPRDAFVQGLASFALAQMMFTVSFAVDKTNGGRLVVGLVVVLPVAAFLARRFVAAIRTAGQVALVLPVSVYIVVISTMAVASVAGGSAIAMAGATLFMLSDSLIAEMRFVKARPWHPVGIMVTYHLALAGLVLGLY